MNYLAYKKLTEIVNSVFEWIVFSFFLSELIVNRILIVFLIKLSIIFIINFIIIIIIIIIIIVCLFLQVLIEIEIKN